MWRAGRRPRRFGPRPQLFDKVVTLTPLTGHSGMRIGAGSEGTVVDTEPPGSHSPRGYVLEIPLPGPGVRFDLTVAKPYEIVVGQPRVG